MSPTRQKMLSVFAALTLLPCAVANTNEVEVPLLPSITAYSPVPSPDGTRIAFLKTGFDRPGGTGGLGSSNLESNLMIMTSDGTLITHKPLADAFISGWANDGRVIAYRDWDAALINQDGKKKWVQMGGNTDRGYWEPERVGYLAHKNTLFWVRQFEKESRIETPAGILAHGPAGLRDLTSASPDGTFIAVVSYEKHLWTYAVYRHVWADLGPMRISNDDDEFDWYKIPWNPWSMDGKHLTFVSGQDLVSVSPDGADPVTICKVGPGAMLPVFSPNGERIAFITSEPRPLAGRADLQFWGNSVVWVVDVTSGGVPVPVSSKSTDSIRTLRWIDNRTLVFDRFQDGSAERNRQIPAHIFKLNLSR